MRKRRRDPSKVGDLTLWESVDAEGEPVTQFVEMTIDPVVADSVLLIKQTLRDQGWAQTAGD